MALFAGLSNVLASSVLSLGHPISTKWFGRKVEILLSSLN
jgi:hypothetical protein